MHLKLGQSYTFSKEMFKFKLQLTVTCSLPHEAMPSSPSSTLSIRYLFSVSLSTVLVDRGASRSNPGVTPIRILLVTMHGKLDPNWLKKKEFIGWYYWKVQRQGQPRSGLLQGPMIRHLWASLSCFMTTSVVTLPVSASLPSQPQRSGLLCLSRPWAGSHSWTDYWGLEEGCASSRRLEHIRGHPWSWGGS